MSKYVSVMRRMKRKIPDGKVVSREEVLEWMNNLGCKDVRIAEDNETDEYIVHAKAPTTIDEMDVTPSEITFSSRFGEIKE